MDWGKYVVYDETSPTCLRWAVDIEHSKYTPYHPRKVAGDVAGTSEQDYYRVYVKPSKEFAHRIVWTLLNGGIPEGFEVDHEDGDRFNNRINNLRLVPKRINLRNKRKLDANSSGVTGVSVATNKHGIVGWRARWYDLDGKERSKTFTFHSYGESAFILAQSARDEAIKELNRLGAGYTERHGK